MKRFIGFLLALLLCLNCSLAVAEGLISGETEARASAISSAFTASEPYRKLCL